MAHTGTPRKASALQLERYGHIAAALRRALKQRKWAPADLNAAMGRDRSSPGIYTWLRGIGAPARENQEKLVEVLGLTMEDLTPRQPRQELVVAKGPAKTTTGGELVRVVTSPVRDNETPKPVRVLDVMSFAVQDNGEARIKLDVTLPLEQAKPLIRLLLDAEAVMNRALE